MGNFLKKIKTEILAIKRDKAPVTLADFAGWEKTSLGFQLANLKIHNTEKGFYYEGVDYVLRKVKNVKMLSDLVFGNIKYLK